MQKERGAFTITTIITTIFVIWLYTDYTNRKTKVNISSKYISILILIIPKEQLYFIFEYANILIIENRLK
jgi:hypothetical protein